MTQYLLFQAITPQQVAACRYFLLKYLAIYNLKPPSGIAVLVYTNQPVSFEGFTNFIPQFLMPSLSEKAPVFSKAELLQQFFLQYNGAVLYCDVTTYPVQPLEPLFTDIEHGNCYLHAPRRYPESELSAALRTITSVLDKTKNAATTPASRINVWHAAVVGLTSQHRETIAAICQSAPANGLALDYAFTKQLGEQGKIKSAARYLFDYGGFKEFDQLLQAFFKKSEEESIPNQVKLLHHIDAAAIQQQKAAYQEQPALKKWLLTLTGKRWSIQSYINKF